MDAVTVSFPKLNLEFPVNREAFTIGSFSIYWYAIFIAVGAILAVIYAMSQAKKYGIDSDKLLDVGIVSIIFGIIGARAYYVIFNIDNYSSFGEMLNIRDGGLAIYGGLILGILAGFIMTRINKTRFLPSLDVAAGGFLIGQALGRWGNFTNQEAFGVNTDSIFGMYSQSTNEYLTTYGWSLFKKGIEVNPAKPVHPCFLYESIWCIIGILIIVLIYRKIRKFDGEIFLFYCAWYGLGRGFIEGIRTDSLYIGQFRVSQLLSFTICILAAFLIIAIRFIIAKKRKDNPRFMMLYADTDESKALFMESDETVIEKAEVMLTEASQTLDDAQSKLNALLGEKNDEESLEDMAEELSTPQEKAELIDKLIDLSIAKITVASTLLDRYVDEDVIDEDISELEILDGAEDITEEDEDEEPTFEDRLNILGEQIESARDYILECYDIIESQKELLFKEDEEEIIEEEEEEILDPVTDEADELDIPSPNDNK